MKYCEVEGDSIWEQMTKWFCALEICWIVVLLFLYVAFFLTIFFFVPFSFQLGMVVIMMLFHLLYFCACFLPVYNKLICVMGNFGFLYFVAHWIWWSSSNMLYIEWMGSLFLANGLIYYILTKIYHQFQNNISRRRELQRNLDLWRRRFCTVQAKCVQASQLKKMMQEMEITLAQERQENADWQRKGHSALQKMEEMEKKCFFFQQLSRNNRVTLENGRIMTAEEVTNVISQFAHLQDEHRKNCCLLEHARQELEKQKEVFHRKQSMNSLLQTKKRDEGEAIVLKDLAKRKNSSIEKRQGKVRLGH